MRPFFFICLLALSFFSEGCGSATTRQVVPSLPHAMPVDPPGGSYMLVANTYAGDALNSMLVLRMSSAGGILTTSFVNIHDFEQTSAFGRVASQQVGSRLGQHGFRVLEARLASTLSMVPRIGEFMLTRETARLLADTYDAGAVLVGSYSDEGGSVFVSARVVRLSDNAIMAAYEYVLPRDGDVSSLLTAGQRGGSAGDSFWERNATRTPAFPGGTRSVSAYTPAPTMTDAGKTVSPQTPGGATASLKSGEESPVTMQGGGPAVPRYVDPAAKDAAAPASRASQPRRAASAAPAPVSPTAIPTEKDAPAPPSVSSGV